MRRRMQDLSAGVFEYEGPRIKLSEDRLLLSATEGEDLKGSFRIESTNGVPMRGIIYSDNPRMDLLNAQFSGVVATIEYQFHIDGLIRGDIQRVISISFLIKTNITFLLL